MGSYQKNEKLSSGQTPGVWVRLQNVVKFTCPICGLANDLDPATVGQGGVVLPKFKCAAEGCEFTEDIVLSGWGA